MSHCAKPFIWKWVWFAWKWTCTSRWHTFPYEWFRKDSFWHRGKRQLENGLFSDFPVPTSLAISDSRKYPYLYHGWLFGIPWARGGSLNWKCKGIEVRRHSWQLRIATCKTSIIWSGICFRVHLKNTDKVWLVHWAPEALKLMNFLLDICLQWKMLGYHAPVIYIHKETAMMASDWVNIVCNIKSKLGQICLYMFLFL